VRTTENHYCAAVKCASKRAAVRRRAVVSDEGWEMGPLLGLLGAACKLQPFQLERREP
jgi:hypothetical protein